MAKEMYIILVGLLAFFNTLVGFFGIRLIRKYDEQIRELYERSQDLPAIREAIAWIKDIIKNGKRR